MVGEPIKLNRKRTVGDWRVDLILGEKRSVEGSRPATAKFTPCETGLLVKSTGLLLPFDLEIEKTFRRNSKETGQRKQSLRVQLSNEQPPLMADHDENPPLEGREEHLYVLPKRFVAPVVS
ncbi:hypothetical protein Syun_030165 [Stephania yunnanensis]|uniref:Uncharacterized protein n=1 Tax=Stephania yunnanensis TaxID=152371 RepID=A0AAP0E705_9MAGN